LPEGGKVELKLVQTGYAGGVNNLCTRQISVQISMGRDEIVCGTEFEEILFSFLCRFL